MDKKVIQLLKSSNPNDRIDGIKQLEASGHPDSYKILGSMYKSEQDPEVKKAVADAAKRIKAGSSASKSGGSKVDPQQARVYLERAMDAVIEFKNDEAWEWAHKAFEADPSLAEDDYAVGVASEITGQDRLGALEALMSAGPATEEEKPKRGKNEDSADRISWGKAMAWLAGYAAVIAVLIAIPFLLGASVLAPIMATLDPEMAGEAAAASGGFAIIGVIGAVGAFFGVILAIMFQYAFIHFSSTSFLGGVGYYTNLLYNSRWLWFAQLVIQIVMIIATIFVAGATLAGASIDPNTGEFTAQPNAAAGIVQGVNALISIGFLYWFSSIIGKTYDFGAVKGCLSIIVSGIVMAVAICGCYFAVFATVLGAMGQSGAF